MFIFYKKIIIFHTSLIRHKFCFEFLSQLQKMHLKLWNLLSFRLITVFKEINDRPANKIFYNLNILKSISNALSPTAVYFLF